MAGKLIPLSEAAALLGVSPDRLNELRQSNEIYGYRDGASWKFKQEDVERLKESLDGGGSAGSSNTSFDDLDFALPMGDEKDDLMLAPDLGLSPSSDVKMGSEQIRGLARNDSELTLSSPGSHPSPKGPANSDVSLASDVIKGLMGNSEMVPPTTSGTMRMHALTDAAGADDDEFVLGSPIDSDPGLTGSKTVLKSGSGLFGSGPIQLGGENVLDSASLSFAGGTSSIGLGDEHDNVLGGTGSGSDITHRPGDSGILLIDPADSGLSLEAPPSLSGSRIGEGTVDFQSGAEDDFLLKPFDEGSDDDSESGSQVIMLDSEGAFDEKSSTLIADSLPGMPGGMDFGGAMGGGLSGGMMGEGASPAPQAVIPPGMVVVPKETPFSMFSVVGLVACTLVLALGGMMMFDLMRNIWSWDSPNSFSSAIMDSLVGKS